MRRAILSLRTSKELQSKGDDLKTMVTQQLTNLNKQQQALSSARGILDLTGSRVNGLNTLMDTHFTASQLILRVHCFNFIYVYVFKGGLF